MKQVIQENRFFPVSHRKVPTQKGWSEAIGEFKPGQRQGWWTGKGILAVDVDRKNGKDGTLWRKYSDLPETHTVKTPSGGEHRLYWYDSSLKTKNSVSKMAPGIDVRGDGGYIVWYSDTPYIECAKAPEWLLSECLDTRSFEKKTNTDSIDSDMPTPDEYERVKSVLYSGIYDVSCYEDWFKAGCIMKSTGVNESLVDWLEWSSLWPSFDRNSSLRQWAKIRTNEGFSWRTALYEGSQAKVLPEEEPEKIEIPFFRHSEELTPTDIQVVPEELLSIPTAIGEELNDYFKQIAPNPHPEISVAGSVILMALMSGRNYVTTYNNVSALYMCVLAPSATGKDFIRSGIKNILQAACYEDLNCDEFYKSDSAIAWTLISKPNHIILVDEYGMIIDNGYKSKNSFTKSILTKLVSMYSSFHSFIKLGNYSGYGKSQKEREYIDKTVIYHPCINMLALSTPGRYWGSLKSEAIKDGFLNRHIHVETTLKLNRGFELNTDAPVSKHIIDWCHSMRGQFPDNSEKSATDRDHKRIKVGFDQDAKELIIEHKKWEDSMQAEHEGSDFEEWFSRTNENAMRVALALAASEAAHTGEKPVVQSKHYEWSFKYCRHYAVNAFLNATRHIGTTQYEERYVKGVKTAQRCIKKHGPMPAGHLSRYAPFKGHPLKTNKELLNDMVSRGDIDCETVELKNGKTALYYKVIK